MYVPRVKHAQTWFVPITNKGGSHFEQIYKALKLNSRFSLKLNKFISLVCDFVRITKVENKARKLFPVI